MAGVVAIVGRANVGKSTIFNRIVGERISIVEDIAGVTRDRIYATASWLTKEFRLIDTGGIELKDASFTTQIKMQAEIAIEEADLIIAIFDASKKLSKEDKEILEIIKGKKSIILLNKIDLTTEIQKNDPIFKELTDSVIEISALNNVGIEKLYDEITKLFELNEIQLDNELVITNIRHKKLISKAIESVKKAKHTLEENMPIDIVAVYIKDILEDIGTITGEFVTEDIINEIFSKFCLGK